MEIGEHEDETMQRSVGRMPSPIEASGFLPHLILCICLFVEGKKFCWNCRGARRREFL